LSLEKYWNFRDEITVLDGLLYKSQRIMVPKTLQREMLVKLHESHLGIVKTKQRARESIGIPCLTNMDLNAEIVDTLDNDGNNAIPGYFE
jgi:hypothetical protein